MSLLPNIVISKLGRLHQIYLFAQLALSPLDLLKLVVVGFARGHPFESSDLVSKLGRKLFPSLTVKTKTLQGKQITVNPSDLGHLISFQEIMLERCYDLKVVPFEPELILDCGAHIGLFSVLATQKYPKSDIIAFEPNPENIEYIEQQLKLNTLNKISVLQAAVSVREGTSWFYASYSNSGYLQANSLKNAQSYRVQIIDLPEFIKTRQVSTLLIKLDIEGEEANVIPKLVCQLPHQCAIFFECHGGEESWQQLSQLLIAANFQVQVQRCRLPYIDGFAFRT